MSGIKRLFMLLIVVLGIAVMGIAVIAALMIFIPNLSIFGLNYVSEESYKSNVASILNDSTFEYKKIDIETTDVDVCIMGASELVTDNIFVKIQYKFSGFVKNELLTPEFIVTQNLATNTIKIVSKEPTGIVFGTDMILYVHLPESKTFTDVNIVTKNGAVLLGNEEAVTTANVNNIDIKKTGKNKSIKLLEKLNLNDSITLNTTSSKFIATKDIGTSLNNIEVNLSSQFSAFEFKNIYGNFNVSDESDAPAVYIETLNGNFDYSAKQGYARINLVNGQSTINTVGGDFKFGEIRNAVGVIGTDSSVEIDKLIIGTADASFETGNGIVTINEATAGKISITTNKGAVKVLKASTKLDVQTNYGVVNVEYLDSFSKMGSDICKIITNNGSINAKNLRNGVYLESKQNSQITASFVEVVGGNNIIGTNNVFLTLLVGDYILRAETINGGIDVALGLSCQANNWDNAWETGDTKIQDFNVNAYIDDYDHTKFTTSINSIYVKTTNGTITAKTPNA